MIHDPKSSVRGTLVTGLRREDVRSLDRFEGSQYERVVVKVRVLEAKKGELKEGEEVEAETYLFLYEEDLEKGEWDFEHFFKEKMPGRWADGEEFAEVDEVREENGDGGR